jgi:hypothetical protein
MNLIKLIAMLALITSLTACDQTTDQILAIISSLTSYGQPEENRPKIRANWTTLYETDYSIDYPERWELDKSGQMGTSFMLFSPLLSKEDKFKENVNLLIQDLTGHNVDLDKYVEISEDQINTMITDGKIIESKRIIGESMNHHKVMFTGKQDIYNLKFEQYYWVIRQKAFVLTFTCEERQFNNYRATGERILNSFNLVQN